MKKLSTQFHRPVIRTSFFLAVMGLATAFTSGQPTLEDGTYHVYPGQSIQKALDAAAKDPDHKSIVVHEGVYRPMKKAQALIWFNTNHDGITLEARGDVTLTAENPDIADSAAASYPAVVNHVVYFGDGITRKTFLRGFKITGGNNYVTDQGSLEVLEPHYQDLKRTEGFYRDLFFYSDGAGVKIFGRSYPTLENLLLHDNYASPCGGAISVEHRGYVDQAVLIENCVFRNNSCLVTGSAVDLLPGSNAAIVNCLFVGNVSNKGMKYEHVKGNIDWPIIGPLVKSAVGYQPNRGSGALTVFPGSRAAVHRCTFLDNFNGTDDKGLRSQYTDCIFWMNNKRGGKRSGGRYELDIQCRDCVKNCFINGDTNDVRDRIDPDRNTLNCPDPDFDNDYRPRNPVFSAVGYRPVSH